MRRRPRGGAAAGLAGARLVLATALAAVLATPSYPALAAATPECVADEELPAANALVTGVENAGWIAGPGLLGLVMLAGFGPAAATGLAGAMFLFASWWAWQVRLPRPARVDGGGTVAELLEGVRVVTHNARVRNPMTVAVLDNFLYGFLVVAAVLLGERVLGGSDAVGWLNAGLSVGALSAMLVVTPLTARGRPVVQLGVAMLGYAATVGLLGVAGLLDSLPAAVVLVVAAGAGTLLTEVIAVTLLQRAAPPAVTARVFGVYDQLNVGAIAVGSLLAGPLADRLGTRSVHHRGGSRRACSPPRSRCCGSVAVRGTRWARGTGPERCTRFRWSRSWRADVSKEFFAKQRSGTLRRATASSVSASLSSRHAMTTQLTNVRAVTILAVI